MEYETALGVFEKIEDLLSRPSQLEWLTNILLGYQTFLSLLRQFPPNCTRVGQVPPFEALPNLRRLYIGFARRCTEIVLVEGIRAENVFIPIEAVEESHDEHGIPTKWHVAGCGGVELHAGLEAMIMAALHDSSRDIGALKADGVEVEWVVIKEVGVTRRRDVIRGYDILSDSWFGKRV
jgi:hypothetical protein